MNHEWTRNLNQQFIDHSLRGSSCPFVDIFLVSSWIPFVDIFFPCLSV